MKTTFKQFTKLNEAQDLDQAMLELAEFIIKNKFKHNVENMITGQTPLFRGSSVEIPHGQIYTVSKQYTTARKSLYDSSNNLMQNLWHEFNMPDRRHAKFASDSKNAAEDFGEPMWVVPKDGTTVFGVNSDFNYSFREQNLNFFGVDMTFGDARETVVSTLKRLCRAYRKVDDKKTELMLGAIESSNENNKTDPAFFKLMDELFAFLAADPKTKIPGINTDFVDVPLFVNNVKKYGSFEKFLRKYFDACDRYIMSGTNISKVVLAVTDVGAAELWWSSDTLVLPASLARPEHAKKLLAHMDYYVVNASINANKKTTNK